MFPGTGFQHIDSWTTETPHCFLALVFNTSTPGQPRLYLFPGTGFQHDSTPGQPRRYLLPGAGFQRIDSKNRLLDNRDSTLSLALVFNTSTPGQPRLYLVPGSGFQHIDSWTTETLSLPGTGFQHIDSWTTETLPSPWHWFSTHRRRDNRDSTFSMALVFNTSTPGQPRLYLVPGTGFQHIDSQNRLLDNRDSTLFLALVFNT